MTVLTKNQKKTFGPRFYTEHGERFRITAKVRYDDECGNGHNTFSITADIDEKLGNGQWRESGGGCCHELVAKHFPELAPLIKWHLVSSDGPMHYIANTVYHADQHGPTHAWVYYTGRADPLGVGGSAERLLGYEKAADAKKAEGQPGYRVEWDAKTTKTRNLDHARSSAVWPDATDEELTAPDLKEQLTARLPALLSEFRAAVESLGFIFLLSAALTYC
jgi:hypothetical protein